jgi:hypothetical protein
MQPSTVSYVGYRKRISPVLKMHIVHRLQLVDANTILGMAFHNFAVNAGSKTEKDYHDLLLVIKTQMKEDAQVTRKVLGIHYRFFKKLTC